MPFMRPDGTAALEQFPNSVAQVLSTQVGKYLILPVGFLVIHRDLQISHAAACPGGPILAAFGSDSCRRGAHHVRGSIIVDDDRGEDSVFTGQSPVTEADGRHHLFQFSLDPDPQRAGVEFQAGALQGVNNLGHILGQGWRVQAINAEMRLHAFFLSGKKHGPRSLSPTVARTPGNRFGVRAAFRFHPRAFH